MNRRGGNVDKITAIIHRKSVVERNRKKGTWLDELTTNDNSRYQVSSESPLAATGWCGSWNRYSLSTLTPTTIVTQC